jgi:hypothetical protein
MFSIITWDAGTLCNRHLFPLPICTVEWGYRCRVGNAPIRIKDRQS